MSSATNGKLRFSLGELSALPRAAVVVEERWSSVFKLVHQRPAVVADAIAELQVRFPTVPVFFAETRSLAEEWTYRWLAAAIAEHALARGGAERLLGPVEAGNLPEVDGRLGRSSRSGPPGRLREPRRDSRVGRRRGTAGQRPRPPAT